MGQAAHKLAFPEPTEGEGGEPLGEWRLAGVELAEEPGHEEISRLHHFPRDRRVFRLIPIPVR